MFKRIILAATIVMQLSLATTLILPITSHAVPLDPKVKETVKTTVEEAIQNVNVEEVRRSAVPGILEVTAGSEIFYITEDSHFLIYGTLLDLKKDRLEWNLTEQRKRDIRKKMLAQLPAKEMVVYPAKGKSLGHVYIFTDVDCYYCQRLHQEIESIQNRGIEVRYLAFPRSGVGSESYQKIVSVWCADDPLLAMTHAKAGKTIEGKTCQNPVSEQFNLGREIGITGTPALLFENGVLWPGYLPADQIQSKVKEYTPQAKS